MEASSGHIESAQEINNLTHMHKHTRTHTVTLLLALGCGVLGQISTPNPQRKMFSFFLKLCDSRSRLIFCLHKHRIRIPMYSM